MRRELMASGLDAMRKTIRETEPVRPSTQLAQDLVAIAVAPRPSAAELSIPSSAEILDHSRQRLRLKEQINRLRGDLDWIVMKCLEKDRSRRYDTANGLAADVKRHLANEPIVARRPSAAYKFQKAFRRNRLVFAAGTAVAASLAIGMGVSTTLFFRATQASREARDAEATAIKGEGRGEEAEAGSGKDGHRTSRKSLCLRNQHGVPGMEGRSHDPRP